MSENKIINNLNNIQKNLDLIFNKLDIPYTYKIEKIRPLKTELVESKAKWILDLIEEIKINIKNIELEKLIKITDFQNFLKEINEIIKYIIEILKNGEKIKYNCIYLLIKLYWYIEYFKKHEIEFKNNEFFNESIHYKWIVDDVCLEILTFIQENSTTLNELIQNIDKKRYNTLIGIKLINIENEMVKLTSLGKIMLDLTNIGDIYIYYIDEFNELFEELV